MTARRVVAAVTALSLACGCAAGCGVGTEDEPRTITGVLPVPETASTPEVTNRPHSPTPTPTPSGPTSGAPASG